MNQAELTDLFKQPEGLHASLFMPVETEPDKQQMNHIRLKNLIKQARQQVETDGFLPSDLLLPDMQQFFQPALELLSMGRFAVEQSQGLAVFLSSEIQRIYRLPLSVAELVVIGPRFHIKPLLPYLNGNGRFYLLTLSQNQVQLWYGTQFSLEQVEVPGLPAGMDEALADEDPEPAIQYHTSTGQSGDRRAMFHGHDADKEKKGAVLRYCREINIAVQKQLVSEEIPLLLASVGYLWPIYQEANTYPHLLSDGISGNPDNVPVHELHELTWQIVQHHYQQNIDAVTNQYRELAGTEKTSQSVTEIMPAAAYGRVEALLVPAGIQKRGRFDPASGEVEMCQADVFRCEDLLNLAAMTTVLHDGTVYVVQPEDMPDEAEIAAIFRYAV